MGPTKNLKNSLVDWQPTLIQRTELLNSMLADFQHGIRHGNLLDWGPWLNVHSTPHVWPVVFDDADCLRTFLGGNSWSGPEDAWPQKNQTQDSCITCDAHAREDGDCLAKQWP